MTTVRTEPHVKVRVDNRIVQVPVSAAQYAHFVELFVRDHPSERQRRVHGTVMNLMRVAYKKGLEDGMR